MGPCILSTSFFILMYLHQVTTNHASQFGLFSERGNKNTGFIKVQGNHREAILSPAVFTGENFILPCAGMLMKTLSQYFGEAQFPNVNMDLTMSKRIKSKKGSVAVYIQLFFANILHY